MTEMTINRMLLKQMSKSALLHYEENRNIEQMVSSFRKIIFKN